MTMITDSQATPRRHAPASLLATIARRFDAYRRNRHVLRDLATMEDHILADIGLSRADIVQASAAEFGASHAAMLDRARFRRLR